jgi:hypothetical protein
MRARARVQAGDVAHPAHERHAAPDPADRLGEKERLVCGSDREQQVRCERERHSEDVHSLGADAVGEGRGGEHRDHRADEQGRGQEAGLHVADPKVGLEERDERGLVGVRDPDRDRRQRREQDAAGPLAQGRRS